MKCCGTCKHWGRDEPRPQNFAACRYPLPEAVLEFIANGQEGGVPAFLKLHDAGRNCIAYSEMETVPAPEASIVKAFERSPRRVDPFDGFCPHGVYQGFNCKQCEQG